MYRIRWRDGMPRRPYYGTVGKFDSDGRSVRHWSNPRHPFIRRFFALNQHRQWFDLVCDEQVGAPPDAEIKQPATETTLETVTAATPVAVVAVAEEVTDADVIERPRRRGRNTRIRKDAAQGDRTRARHLGERDCDGDQKGGAEE
jgi:hypothetical protein